MPFDEQLERQDVVVAVAAAAAHADVAAVDEHVRGRIAQHVETAVRERGRTSARQRLRAASNGRCAVRTEQPERFVAEVVRRHVLKSTGPNIDRAGRRAGSDDRSDPACRASAPGRRRHRRRAAPVRSGFVYAATKSSIRSRRCHAVSERRARLLEQQEASETVRARGGDTASDASWSTPSG